MTTEIMHDTRKGIYEVWVWITPYCCERRAHRKSLNAARNAALRYGHIRKISEI